ncbi:MAG: hypothetical protein ABWZ36_01275, partial [Jiangellaceae bacterium]
AGDHPRYDPMDAIYMPTPAAAFGGCLTPGLLLFPALSRELAPSLARARHLISSPVSSLCPGTNHWRCAGVGTV